MVFDMENRRIGFAPSITKFNEGIILRMENLIHNFEKNFENDFIIFLTVALAIFLIVLIFLAYKYLSALKI